MAIKMNLTLVNFSPLVSASLEKLVPGISLERLVNSVNASFARAQLDDTKAAKASKGKYSRKSGFCSITETEGRVFVSDETAFHFYVFANAIDALYKTHGMTADSIAIPAHFSAWLLKHKGEVKQEETPAPTPEPVIA